MLWSGQNCARRYQRGIATFRILEQTFIVGRVNTAKYYQVTRTVLLYLIDELSLDNRLLPAKTAVGSLQTTVLFLQPSSFHIAC